MRKVKWSIRDDGNSTWAKHYCDEYVVFVTDMDGDGTEWSVWLRSERETINAIAEENERIADVFKRRRLPDPLTRGYVCVRTIDDFEIGQAIAIEALDRIIAARSQSETEAKP
jgi:hypothetical protein